MTEYPLWICVPITAQRSVLNQTLTTDLESKLSNDLLTAATQMTRQVLLLREHSEQFQKYLSSQLKDLGSLLVESRTYTTNTSNTASTEIIEIVSSNSGQRTNIVSRTGYYNARTSNSINHQLPSIRITSNLAHYLSFVVLFSVLHCLMPTRIVSMNEYGKL